MEKQVITQNNISNNGTKTKIRFNDHNTKKINNDKKMEEQGIDPCAFCMQSRRSTIWATPPHNNFVLKKVHPVRIELTPTKLTRTWVWRLNHSATDAVVTKIQKINLMTKINMCSMRGSNPRLLAHKTNTLPTELMELFKLIPAVIKSSKKGCARVEPATYRAATDCSTTELTPHC